MSILPFYNGLVCVDNNGQRGTDNYYAQYPFRTLYGAAHTFYVYYCGNPDCLHRIRKTWVACPWCGQRINWEVEIENGRIKAKGTGQASQEV
jgi:hypothetical protein